MSTNYSNSKFGVGNLEALHTYPAYFLSSSPQNAAGHVMMALTAA
jgi:hypothetical protein